MTRTFTYALLVLFVAIAALAYLYGPIFFDDEALARRIVNACAGEPDRSRCYETKVPRLLDEGMPYERTFIVTALIQEMDPDFYYCHVLAHLLSEKETARDPTKWKDVIARAPPGVCGNGALHGAFQERFKRESMPNAALSDIEALLVGTCDARPGWDPTPHERSSCMHGMGHLTMYITEADVAKSVLLCDRLGDLPDHDFRLSCLEGVFMQIYQPLELEDRDLVARIAESANDRDSFCAHYVGHAHTACIKESWPTEKAAIMTPEGFESFCMVLNNEDARDYCLSGLTYVVMGMNEYNAEKMLPLCESLELLRMRDTCIAQTATRFIETDWRNVSQSLRVCERAGISSSTCYARLMAFGENAMHPSSPEFQALCNGMPEPWQSKCAGQSRVAL